MITKNLKKVGNSTISSLFAGIVVIVAMFMTVACEKDIETTGPEVPDVSIDKGILVFKDNATFQKTLNDLNDMSEDERRAWENQLGFKSMLTIFYDINIAEDKNQNLFYDGVDDKLEKSELEQKGLYYQRTEIYKKYLDSGMIEEIEEKDGSISFGLTIYNKVFSKLVNEDGMVIIGSKIYNYSSEKCVISSLDDMSVIETYYYDTKGDNNWSSYTTATVPALPMEAGWAKASTTQRFKLSIIGTSSNSMHYMSSTYYAEAIGEQKKWGNWAIRNTYNPIYRISGNWVYRWIKTYDGGPFVNVYDLADSDFSSPFSYTLNGSNHCLFSLEPNGGWSFYDGDWYIWDGPEVTQKSFTGSFYGGQNGYSIYLN